MQKCVEPSFLFNNTTREAHGLGDGSIIPLDSILCRSLVTSFLDGGILRNCCRMGAASPVEYDV